MCFVSGYFSFCTKEADNFNYLLYKSEFYMSLRLDRV